MHCIPQPLPTYLLPVFSPSVFRSQSDYSQMVTTPRWYVVCPPSLLEEDASTSTACDHCMLLPCNVISAIRGLMSPSGSALYIALTIVLKRPVPYVHSSVNGVHVLYI